MRTRIHTHGDNDDTGAHSPSPTDAHSDTETDTTLSTCTRTAGCRRATHTEHLAALDTHNGTQVDGGRAKRVPSDCTARWAKTGVGDTTTARRRGWGGVCGGN